MVIKKITSDKMSNHIEEYFANQEATKEVMVSKELFKADKDVDIKTDLSWKEIVLINKLMFNDLILKKYKLTPVFSKFLIEYMRLKISFERKSRKEFVDMNKNSNSEELIKGMSDISNITNSKK